MLEEVEGDNMRIYIAGSWGAQKRLREPANHLWNMGHEVVSTWLNEVKRPEFMPSEVFKKKLAMKDLCEVSRADLLILDTIDPPSGGKNAEFGFALGSFQNKQVWMVGPPSSVFHYLADISFVNWEECLSFMEHYQTNEIIAYHNGQPIAYKE